ncbi:MAG: hypothetical protein RIT25_907 [Planctomycetota bacterium]|jgi:hypothetical protein
MYGLINKAVEGLIRSRFGDDTWNRIRESAGLPDRPFLSMEQYPDASTYALVGAASRILGAEPEAILREFGRYWTEYTGEAGYGELMRSAGKTLPEFLRNLDQMHTRIQLALPHLKPPSFTVSDETADSLVLHYFSDREGLAALVEGLVDGLAKRFSLEVTIRRMRAEAPTPHDAFHLSWRPATVRVAT